MKNIYLILLALIPFGLFSQSHYAIILEDKAPDRVTDFINNPLEMLTQRAIDRRHNLNISFDEIDVPIDKNFISNCSGTGAEILAHSKWLNTIFVDATTEQIDLIKKLSFVKEVKPLEQMTSGKKLPNSANTEVFSKKMSTYGQSEVFIKQIKTDFLHNKDFKGDNIQIAVLDAGFPGVETTDPFKELRDRNGILGTYNFVADVEDVYRDSDHGTMVLSTMAVDKPNTYIGTAPQSDYWLFTTEDNHAETPREEFFWIEAIEFADSVGVDVLNSSLGYQDFDSDFISYTYSDMDGETTFISRAASIGGQKGILVVISAGNEGDEGDEKKRFIWSPADAKNIITAGAVTSTGTVSGFSSFGPSADGRIKPDVAAMGTSVPVYTSNGTISHVNGTSFSSPITAGSVACLRQAFPKASVLIIIDALHKSADNYSSPDNRTGYGIANFEEAYNILKEQLSLNEIEIDELKIIPNPVVESFKVIGVDNDNYQFTISDLSGRIILKGEKKLNENLDVSNLKKGYYNLTINSDKNITIPFIKK